MNRDDLVDLAEIRLKEAQILLENHNYDGAYYLCGYIIECGLKACIAKKTKKYDFPDKETVERSYSHHLTKLLKTAGLENTLKNAGIKNSNLAISWAIVKDWKAESRYGKHTRKEARDLYSAIVNRRNGVLEWIKQYW